MQITDYVLLVLWTALLMSAYIGYLVLVISGEETADFYDLFVLGTSLTAGT